MADKNEKEAQPDSPQWAKKIVVFLTGLLVVIPVVGTVLVAGIKSSQQIRDALGIETNTAEQSKGESAIDDFVRFTIDCGMSVDDSDGTKRTQDNLFSCGNGMCVVYEVGQNEYVGIVKDANNKFAEDTIRDVRVDTSNFAIRDLSEVYFINVGHENTKKNSLHIVCKVGNCIRGGSDVAMDQIYTFTDEPCAEEFKRYISENMAGK